MRYWLLLDVIARLRAVHADRERVFTTLTVSELTRVNAGRFA